MPHAALNRWAIDEVAARRADGSLRLAHEAGGGGVIEQLVAKAGDVVLMHPWTVHSGTGGRARHRHRYGPRFSNADHGPHVYNAPQSWTQRPL